MLTLATSQLRAAPGRTAGSAEQPISTEYILTAQDGRYCEYRRVEGIRSMTNPDKVDTTTTQRLFYSIVKFDYSMFDLMISGITALIRIDGLRVPVSH